jgi:hypothetical protein
VRRYLLLILLAVGLGVAPPSSATLVKTFSMPEMTHASHDIIRGYVTAVQAVYDPSNKHVYTHTTVEVVEDLRQQNTQPRIVVVRQLGGSLDGFETTLVGNAHLGLGEEIVLFARTDGAFHYVVGMAQGKYNVRREKGKAATLQRSLAGIRGVKRIYLSRPQAANTLSLGLLRSQIQTTLKKAVKP